MFIRLPRQPPMRLIFSYHTPLPVSFNLHRYQIASNDPILSIL